MKRSITRYMTAGLALVMILPAGAGVSMKADAAEETWVVYWYLCGSDLESNYGAVSHIGSFLPSQIWRSSAVI